MIVPRFGGGWLRVAACLLAMAAWRPAAAQESAGLRDIGFDPSAQRYQLGQGLRLGDSGLALGGYATASAAEHAETGTNLRLQSLSGFLWWDNGGRWHAFSEIEAEDLLNADEDTLTTRNADLELERLYVDYTATDLLKFRVGKFLTPVGRWNLIHASPLVWTTTRPLITERTFPTNATGLMVYGSLPWTDEGVEYSLYYSPGEELARDKELDTFREAFGAHLSFSPLPHVHAGLSYVNFEQRYSPDEHRNLYGFDAVWAWHRYEVSGEFHYRVNDGYDYQSNERGLYLQGVAPLSERLYAVARYETFRRSDADRDINVYLVGLNFKLQPALVLKAEYSRATDNDLNVRDGFMASIAVLF
ncbi:porin [Hydrocarboniphaga sp.]|uniref:porin n=1 Tax=Hydrocarboniphaga sp. TaxID=2033016 RepID=UPI003D13A075